MSEADFEFAARVAGWYINERGLFANRLDRRVYYGATPNTDCAWQTLCEFDKIEPEAAI